MTREEYLSIAVSKFDDLQALNKIDNFYHYCPTKTIQKSIERLYSIEFDRKITLFQNQGEYPHIKNSM